MIILGAIVIIISLLALEGIVGESNLINHTNEFITGLFLIMSILILIVGGFIATYVAKEYENRYFMDIK